LCVKINSLRLRDNVFKYPMCNHLIEILTRIGFYKWFKISSLKFDEVVFFGILKFIPFCINLIVSFLLYMGLRILSM